MEKIDDNEIVEFYKLKKYDGSMDLKKKNLTVFAICFLNIF